MAAAQQATAAPVWRKQPKRVFHWRDWGGDSVVFELRSGHTYQFSPFNAAVMGFFEQRDRCSLDDLAAAIGGDLGVPVDDELRSALAASVQQFLHLGWLEPTTPA